MLLLPPYFHARGILFLFIKDLFTWKSLSSVALGHFPFCHTFQCSPFLAVITPHKNTCSHQSGSIAEWSLLGDTFSQTFQRLFPILVSHFIPHMPALLSGRSVPCCLLPSLHKVVRPQAWTLPTLAWLWLCHLVVLWHWTEFLGLKVPLLQRIMNISMISMKLQWDVMYAN